MVPAMSLSPAELAWIVESLRALAGARVQKVALPGERCAALEFWQPGRASTLLLDASPGLARVHLVERRPPSPLRPFAFQGQLRAHLGGARLDGLVLHAAERTLILNFETDDGARSLVAELDPRGGDLLLLDPEGRVLGGTRSEPLRRQRRPDAPRRGERFTAGPALRDDGAPHRFENAGMEGDSRSLALERAYTTAAAERGLAVSGQELRARLAAARKRTERTLTRIDEDARRIADAERFRRFADLLKPAAHKLGRGAAHAKVVEYTETGPVDVVVPLLPHLNGRENLERYYRQHKRLSRATGVVAERRRVIAERLATIGRLLARLDEARTPEALEPIEDDARAAALWKPPGARDETTDTPARTLPYRAFTSLTGRPIRVGRNARANDTLTFEFARGNDVWLHARGLTGAHVVVPGTGPEGADGDTLLDAATLAAHFSAGRGELFVDVAWTRRKFVGRPRKAAPGAVTYTQERAVAVRRDEERLKRLLASEGATTA